MSDATYYTYGPKKIPSYPYWLRTGFFNAANNTLRNIYFWTNILYFAYCVGILQIDYDFYNTETYEEIDRHYIAYNWLHMVTAPFYIAAWLQYGFPLLSVVQIPEVMNIVGAGLYVASGYLYSKENSPTSDDDAGTSSSSSSSSDPAGYYNNDATMTVHRYEMAAATIEMIASFGWFMTWYIAYERKPGRGWTLDDPDSWCNIFLISGSIVYFVYNVQINLDPPSYATNFLYNTGDILYFFSAVGYLCASLRDCGWFFWMPMGGKLGYEMVAQDEAYGTTLSTPMAGGAGGAGEAAKPSLSVGSPLLVRKDKDVNNGPPIVWA